MNNLDLMTYVNIILTIIIVVFFIQLFIDEIHRIKKTTKDSRNTKVRKNETKNKI